MTTKVNLPKSGMGIEEGTVLRWLKAVGDKVSEGDALVEIETAKAIQEVEALVDGTLVRILVAVGETAVVNTAIAEIDEEKPSEHSANAKS
jgi:pyruvate/2-oxoglutarate dehydrogenase complex dihydrolipoamide acyltransferase (E2) component